MTSTHGTHRADIAGVWNLKLAAPIGEQQVRLDIVQDGENFSGTATQGSEAVPFLDCKLQGSQANWHQRITKPFPLNITFDLTFAGNEVSGTCKPGIFPKVKVSGQRAPA